VVSRWRLELADIVEGNPPASTFVRQFDYSSISDVVMQMSYTARDAGGLLRTEAVANVKDRLNDILELEKDNGAGLVRVFSMKREFPDALHQLLTARSTTVTLLPEHFPFLFRQPDFKLEPKDGSIVLIIETKGAVPETTVRLKVGTGTSEKSVKAGGRGFIRDSLTRGAQQFFAGGDERWTLEQAPIDTSTPPGGLTVDNVEDVIFVVHYVVK
jgi:hypothetical protein